MIRLPRERISTARSELLPWFAGCGRVLDCGCGTGEFLELLRGAGITATGLDGDPLAVNACRARGLDVELADLPAGLDGYPVESFDAIMLAHLIEHFPAAAATRMLAALARVLRPGGRLVIVTPNPGDWWMATEGFWLDPAHLRFYPLPLLATLLEQQGFVVRYAGTTRLHRYGNRQSGPRRFINRILNLLIGPHWNQGDLVAVGEKPAAVSGPEKEDRAR